MQSIPELIQNYIVAQNTRNIEARLSCFAPQATVLDEGEWRQGKESIREWMQKTEAQYAQTMKALTCVATEDEWVLTAETSGTFPGSPINLDYHFLVTDNQIARLEVKITPEPRS